MNKNFVLPLIILLGSCPLLFGQTLTAEVPAGGGPISLVAEGDIHAAGLAFTSISGGLLPVPGGLGASPEPFSFFLSNTPNEVTYGNLGSNVEFVDGSCTTLSVGAAAGVTDIVWVWSEGVAVAAPIVIKDVTCGGAVPEPSAIQLLLMGLVGLCSVRRARTRSFSK